MIRHKVPTPGPEDTHQSEGFQVVLALCEGSHSVVPRMSAKMLQTMLKLLGRILTQPKRRQCKAASNKMFAGKGGKKHPIACSIAIKYCP